MLAYDIRAHFLSLARSKLRLCSANHRPGYWSNLPCYWPSTAWAYSEQETENGPWTGTISIALVCYLLISPWSASISIMSVPELFIVLLKGPLHCCIQETDGNCGHDDQSGRGWPWTDHQLSHRTSVDGYSLGACLPTCSGSNDDQSQSRTSACSARYTAATDFCRPCWQRHALPYAWSPPRWENTFWLDDRQ